MKDEESRGDKAGSGGGVVPAQMRAEVEVVKTPKTTSVMISWITLSCTGEKRP